MVSLSIREVLVLREIFSDCEFETEYSKKKIFKIKMQQIVFK